LGGRRVELAAAEEPYRGRGRGGRRRSSGELSTSQPPGWEYRYSSDVHGQETKQNHQEIVYIHTYIQKGMEWLNTNLLHIYMYLFFLLTRKERLEPL